MALKKTILITIVGLGIFIIAILLTATLQKRVFNRRMDFLSERKFGMIYNAPFCEFYAKNYYVPKSINEVDNYQNFYLGDESLKENFLDPFSKENDLLTYLPLYQSDNDSVAIGFAIISVGIDGKQNFTVDTSLTYEEFLNIKAFYNIIENEPGVYQAELKDTVFSLMDLIFGNKDYLIEVINCQEFFLNGSRYRRSIKQIFNSIFFGEIDNQLNSIFLISYTNSENSLEIHQNKNSIVFSDLGYNVFLRFRSASDIFNLNNINQCVCILETVDHNAKEIIFGNCIATRDSTSR